MAELSVEDFARMQESLMTMKTEKLEADDRASRAERELESCQLRLQSAEKGLAKAAKTIAKSKKAKEVQAMIEQHEQETSELTAQRDGLLQNLGELSASNELLTTRLKNSDGTGKDSDTAKLKQLHNRWKKAQAEAARLQTDLEASQAELSQAQLKFQKQLTQSRENIAQDLEADDEATAFEELLTRHVTDETVRDELRQAAGSVSASSLGIDELKTANQALDELLNVTKAKLDKTQQELTNATSKITQLEAASVPPSPGVDHSELQDKLDKLTVKVQRKQAALLDMQKAQAEQEEVHQAALAELKGAHEKAMSQAQEQYETAITACQTEHAAKVSELEASVQTLETTVQAQAEELATLKASGEDSHRGLQEQLTQAQDNIAQLETQLADVSAREQTLTAERDVAKSRCKQVEQDLEGLEGDLQRLQTETIESREEALRRRGQLDELALEKDRQVSEWQAKMAELETEQNTKMAELEAKIVELEEQVSSARQAQSQMETEAMEGQEQLTTLKEDLVRLEETNNSCSQQLSQQQTDYVELEGDYRRFKTGCRQLIVTLRVAQEERIAKHVAQCATAQAEMEAAQAQLAAVQADTKATSQRSVRDAAMIKELRKELAREKKKLLRVESDLSAQPASSAVSSLSSSPKPVRRSHRRTPSASSNRSLVTVASLDSYGGVEGSDSLGNVITQDEQASLLERMTAMQTAKAELEDQVRRSRKTCQDLQAELSKKSLALEAITQASTQVPSASKSPAKPNTKASIQALQQANQQLQTLVEETLMKNIQLETLVEELTKPDNKPDTS
eukprot:m.217889 g.217889  ORF g.217889 m.217889 type:complete len:799 (+) comp17208_c0_seq6:87-2483(+)